jgi:hypothetical protein
MTQASGSGIVWLFHQPWYVIVGVVAAALVAGWAENRMKERGWWPYKGDNMFIDNAIWGAGLLIVVVPVALLFNWLGV